MGEMTRQRVSACEPEALVAASGAALNALPLAAIA